jgi:hypothetical protein
MAASAGVPIVPVTISDLARWYPKGTLLPIGVPTDVVVTIHPPVHTAGPNKVSESDAIAQTYDAVRTPAPSPPPCPCLCPCPLPLPQPSPCTLGLTLALPVG